MTLAGAISIGAAIAALALLAGLATSFSRMNVINGTIDHINPRPTSQVRSDMQVEINGVAAVWVKKNNEVYDRNGKIGRLRYWKDLGNVILVVVEAK